MRVDDMYSECRREDGPILAPSKLVGSRLWLIFVEAYLWVELSNRFRMDRFILQEMAAYKHAYVDCKTS